MGLQFDKTENSLIIASISLTVLFPSTAVLCFTSNLTVIVHIFSLLLHQSSPLYDTIVSTLCTVVEKDLSRTSCEFAIILA